MMWANEIEVADLIDAEIEKLFTDNVDDRAQAMKKIRQLFWDNKVGFVRLAQSMKPAQQSVTGDDGLIEAIARTLWDVFRAHEIAPEVYRDITWDWLIEHRHEKAPAGFLDCGRAEARAVLSSHSAGHGQNESR